LLSDPVDEHYSRHGTSGMPNDTARLRA
jgi:hypothetical protein